MNDPDREYDIDTLIQEARVRWLKPVEIQFILLNHDGIYPFTEVVPQNPQSGSLFLINKNVTKSFRKDGHNWKKKRSGRTVAEGHERLKVGGVEVLSCYYAQGAENPNLRRRIYWMLDAAYDHIVLVHHRVYTDINEGRRNTEASSTLNLTSTSNPGFQTASIQAAASAVSESYGTYQNPSPFGSGSMDVIPDLIDDNNLFGVWDSPEDICSLMDAESIRAEQRMLDDLNGKSTDTDILLFDQDELLAVQPAAEYRENVGHSCEIEKPQSSLERDKYSTDPHKHNEEYSYQWQDPSGNNTQNRNIDIPIFGDTSNFHPIASTQESSLLYAVGNSTKFSYSYGLRTHEADPNCYTTLFDAETQLAPVEVISRLTVAQCQKFSIQEISPEWGYASECSKVIITGLFHCNSSAHSWKCMFGDVEVPVEIVQEGVFRRQTPPQSPGQVTFIQEGVLRCYTPPKSPGKVTLCITTGNREACSQIREFEYCTTPTASIRNNNLPKTDGMKSAEELQLLIRFVQMLLCDSSTKKKDGITSGTNALEKLIADEYLWENLKHAVLVGSESESRIMDSLLQELLKEKLPQWLHSRFKEGESPGSTSLKKEQEIIHLVAGLGFEWALNLILSSGIGINFRDTKGWTALHHAANFGREEMVVALIVAGASAGAVTDPTPEDPVGKTPGSIAISRGHKGVAGYLSELALTSHLRSLTLEENDLTKGRSDVEAEIEVESLSIDCTDDHHSLRQSLTAVRNAALAAARIQNAFRAHSFRKRKQKEDLVSVCDEFGITAADIPALSATSKMGFPKLRDRVLQNAAVVIQKKYRGWSGQRTFLELKRKIILIQAHVRGHQVRRKLFRWAVGILEKVLLRWRRKRVGLRGLRQETESADASDDEDILKVFRKKKVDVTVERAVSWVVSMAHSRGARGQYCRLLESYRQQVKVESCTETSSASRDDSDSMETNNNDDFFRFPL